MLRYGIDMSICCHEDTWDGEQVPRTGRKVQNGKEGLALGWLEKWQETSTVHTGHLCWTWRRVLGTEDEHCWGSLTSCCSCSRSARGKDRAGREAALLTRGVNLLDPVAHVTRKHHVALHTAAHKEIFLYASLRYLLCGLRQVGRTLV